MQTPKKKKRIVWLILLLVSCSCVVLLGVNWGFKQWSSPKQQTPTMVRDLSSWDFEGVCDGNGVSSAWVYDPESESQHPFIIVNEDVRKPPKIFPPFEYDNPRKISLYDFPREISLYRVELVACVSRVSETLAKRCPYTFVGGVTDYNILKFDAEYDVGIFVAQTGEKLDSISFKKEFGPFECPEYVSVSEGVHSNKEYAYPIEEIQDYIGQQYVLPEMGGD